MKLSVEIYSLQQKFGDFKAAEIIKESGFDALDYSYYWNNENEEVLGDSYIEYAKKLREHFDKIGLKCNQAHAPFTYPYGVNFDESEQKYLYLVRSIESASILGAKNIIVHALTTPKGVDFEEYNVNYYKSLIPYCEKFNIHVAVENLFITDTKRKSYLRKIGTAQELNSILDKINSPWIVGCVDLGHSSLTGNEPEDFIAGVKREYLKSLHVQDNEYLTDCHIIPYTGEFNWEAIMAALKNKNYDGDLTLEIWKYIRRFPDELIPEAMRLAVKVGRYLIKLFEN